MSGCCWRAESAYLEPDRRHGYAYASACASAITDFGETEETVRGLFAERRAAFSSSRPRAIALHLFDENVADDWASRIATLGEVDCYLTLPADIEESAARSVLKTFPDAYIQETAARRGRDILPLTKVFAAILRGNHAFVLRLHSGWSAENELVVRPSLDRAINSLMSGQTRRQIRDASQQSTIGLIVPREALDTGAENIQPRVAALASRLNYPMPDCRRGEVKQF